MIRRLLDHLPHDTLMIGGRPCMRRWYLFGYAPTPGNPDKLMICGTCQMVVHPGCSALDGSGSWTHAAEIMDADHAPVAISATRPGWWWRDHGLGAVRIHEVITSDDSRAFHDHPWTFLSIGLVGTYVEETPFVGIDGAVPPPGAPDNWHRTLRAPFINVKRATDLHVLAVPGRSVWTLFLSRPKTRSWGFAGPFGWLPWRSFDAEFPERNAWTET